MSTNFGSVFSGHRTDTELFTLSEVRGVYRGNQPQPSSTAAGSTYPTTARFRAVVVTQSER